jgi:hypothetical protein
VAAALAVAVAGCGGGGLSLKGDSKDAKAAARVVADSLKPTRPGLRAVACGPLDFELTYRCTVDLGKQAEGLACALSASKGSVADPATPAGAPYCLPASVDARRQAGLATLAGKALARLNREPRLRSLVLNARASGFTIGCIVGFRTAAKTKLQTDDTVLQLIAAQVDTGRAFWATLVVPVADSAPVVVDSGIDPSKKVPTNGYSSCTVDKAGVATLTGEPRDAALLTHA